MAQTPEQRAAAVRARAREQYHQDMAADPEGRRAYMRAWRQKNLDHARKYALKLKAAKRAKSLKGLDNDQHA